MKSLLKQYQNDRKLTTLVENKTTYAAEYSELNIYETNAVAEKISLRFNFPIIASMLTGKKVMHLEGIESFDFYQPHTFSQCDSRTLYQMRIQLNISKAYF